MSLLVIIIMTSSKCKNPEVEIDEDLLTNYHASYYPDSNDSIAEEVDCYLDYSVGMSEGMTASGNFRSLVIDYIKSKKPTFYKVGSSENPPVILINSKEADPLDKNNYSERGSKLKVVIDKIVANKKKVSIFITDFENIPDVSINKDYKSLGYPRAHPIEIDAWAQNQFKDWLAYGNQIDIYAKKIARPDYWFVSKPGISYVNWIYTIVFTPGIIVKHEDLFKESLVKKLNVEISKIDTSSTQHFSFSINNFNVDYGKIDEALGNADENLPVENNIANTKKKGFQYYEFKARDLIDFNQNVYLKDKRIIHKIKIISQSPALIDYDLEIKAFDVTGSIDAFYISKNQDAPEVEQDVETGKKDTINNNSKDFEIRKEIPVDNLFDFVINQDTKEIGVKLKKNFSGVDSTAIYKVNIVIKTAKLMDWKNPEQVLQLKYSPGVPPIKSLGNSIQLAMNDLITSIDNYPIYTFYIKIDK